MAKRGRPPKKKDVVEESLETMLQQDIAPEAVVSVATEDDTQHDGRVDLNKLKTVEDIAAFYGIDLQEVLLTDPGMSKIPDPPKRVLQRLNRLDRVWRWMSYPTVDSQGLRGYETVSATTEERNDIDAGRDTPAGIKVDASNHIRWREDAFLASVPRKRYITMLLAKMVRTKNATEKSLKLDDFHEALRRSGLGTGYINVAQKVTDDEFSNF